MVTAGLVERGRYHDSVVLLELARELRLLPGIEEAAAVMATPANRGVLAAAGLLPAEVADAGPTDLVVCVRAASTPDADAAHARARELLAARGGVRAATTGRAAPRRVASACRQLPGARLALVSVPGEFAAAEARKALVRGLHVMLFSDHVSLETEVELKRLALERGLLLMGPDCGTAYLAG
ncbi:MAG: hypothetical protein L0027_11565, partial [Candidatus Rokubacteria bacterium]|nr:hypothetical protein [Candidatus Rokubacteria bacterium]